MVTLLPEQGIFHKKVTGSRTFSLIFSHRHPIQNHANSLLMHIIHKIHEILGSAIPSRRGKISLRLISHGNLRSIFHHRKQLHMGITHLRQVFPKFPGDFSVIPVFHLHEIPSSITLLHHFPLPLAQICLKDRHGTASTRECLSPAHPLPVIPLIATKLCNDARIRWRRLMKEGAGVAHQLHFPSIPFHLKLIQFPTAHFWNK